MKNVGSAIMVVIVCTVATTGCGLGVFSTRAVQAPTQVSPTSTPKPSSTHTPPSLTPEPQGRNIIISNSADSGTGTLRQALEGAQRYDTITFEPTLFPPDAPETIVVASALPEISQGNLTIDASSAGVILDGSRLNNGSDAAGLVIASNGNNVHGLQIVNFPGPGIILLPGSQNNLIGGDKNSGSGPIGQGNLISKNGNVGITAADASFNTIKGNYIGTDLTGNQGQGNFYQGIYIEDGNNNQIANNLISDNGASGVTLQGSGAHSNILSGNSIGTDATNGNPLGNYNNGIEMREGASNNYIGPDNVVAYNDWSGIEVYGERSLGNTITQNSIHHNTWLGIDMWGGANMELARPVIAAFDLSAGIVEGLAYPNAEVEVFSTKDNEGDFFEGTVAADDSGFFIFHKGASISGPHVVVTSVDSGGNTSEFSLPTSGASGSLSLQRNNPLPMSLLMAMQSIDLKDNHIASFWHSLWGYYPLTELLDEARYMGAKRFRFAINGGEADKVDWSKSEFSIDPAHDEFIFSLADNGIQMTYNLTFWDIATWPGGVGAPCPRFKSEEEIQHYLEYVRFIVRHFKDRIQYYEIWNEPNNTACPQWIQAEDYIRLVRRTVPVIREEYPEAKIQVGGTTGLAGFDSQTYLFSILESNIMPLVDVVSWHPFYGDSPEHNAGYYYSYPSIVQDIKDVAHAHGFVGEFEADEMDWRPHSIPADANHPSYGEIAYAKYWIRGILMNLGMNVTAGNLRIPHQSTTASFAVRYLSTLMAGNEPMDLPVIVQADVANVKSYGFALPNEDKLLAIWIDAKAVDYDPGILSTLVFPGQAGRIAVGIDVLNGFEQQLEATDEGDDLVILDLLIRDYPLIIRLISETCP